MPKLTIAFWNVHNLFEVGANDRAPTTAVELSAKVDALARVLLAAGPPDVIALAEVATRRLAGEIASRVFRGSPRPAPFLMRPAPDPFARTGIAIMGSPSTIDRIDFVDVDQMGGGRPRAVAVDVVPSRRGSGSNGFRFVACHWKSDLLYAGVHPGTDRAASGRWLQAHASKLGPYHAVLVMGDMNTEPFTPEMTNALKACRHYSTTVNGRLYSAVWHWLNEPDRFARTTAAGYAVSRPITTFAGSKRILDHVLVSRGLLGTGPFRLDEDSVRVVTAGTSVTRSTGNVEPLTWSYPPPVGVSDHFPVVAELHY